MSPIAKRQQLHNYIDLANDDDIDQLMAFVGSGMEPDGDIWDDPEFLAEMEDRIQSMRNGTEKPRSMEEVFANIDSRRQSKGF